MKTATALYTALIAANVPPENAEAVLSALEHDMTTILATKEDLRHLTEVFDLKMKAQTNSIVIRMGAIVIAAVAAMEALHKFL